MLAIECLTLTQFEDYHMQEAYPQLLSTYKSRPIFQTYRTNLKSPLETLLSGRNWSQDLTEEFQDFLSVALSLAPGARLDPIDLIGHPVFAASTLRMNSQMFDLDELHYWWLRFNNISSAADLEKHLITKEVLPFYPPVLAIPSVIDPSKPKVPTEAIQLIAHKCISLEPLLCSLSRSAIESIDSKLENLSFPESANVRTDSESLSLHSESIIGKLASLFKTKSSKSDSSTKEKPLRKREFLSEYLRCRKIRQHLVKSQRLTDNFAGLCAVGIPSLLRPDVWKHLLGVTRDYALIYSFLSDTQLSVKYSRQISIDVKRCHQYHPLMSAKAGKKKLETVLSLWLGEHPEMSYIQGIDSVCAVLVLVYYHDLPAVYSVFSEIVKRYLYTLCLQDNSLHIHETFLTFRNLLNYVDPQLAGHLRNIGVTVEMFATPWLLTLYSRIVYTDVFPMEKIVIIWDRLFFHPAAYTTFLGIALLRLFRGSLLLLDQSRIMSLLPHIADFVDIDQWLQEGQDLQTQLPPSLSMLLLTEADQGTASEAWWRAGCTLEVAKKTLAPFIDAHDLMGLIGKALIIEVRSQEEYNQSHVTGSLLIPLNAKPSHTTVSKGMLSTIRSQGKGKIVTVVGDKRKIAHSVRRIQIVNDLVVAEVSQVCLLRGGIDAIKMDAPELLQVPASPGLLGRLKLY